jgi:hypothetical protein
VIENDEVLKIIANELSDSDNIIDYRTPLDYYVGNPDGREVEGRSTVVSTDVADAIEWIMPQIMKAFTQNNEVVIFDPLGPEDEMQAEVESKYVYEVLMKENDGFIILHQFVKDALMHKNGLIKVYYKDTTCVEKQKFSGLTQEQLTVALSKPNVEVLAYDQDELAGTYTVKLAITVPGGKIVLESVPPEQFRWARDHNSINLDDCRFTAHITTKTVSELLEDGYSKKLIESIGESNDNYYSDFRFAAQGETSHTGKSNDPSQREVDIAECFMRMDIDNDGIAERVKVTVAGYESPSTVLSIEEIDYSPWVATTGILMSHKFLGLSIYDRLKQIQDQKTALWRNMLDNIYLQNNQRTVVVEGQVNMDDFLLSRPGGVIRAKRLDAVAPLVTPQLGQDAYNMMQYLDGVRAGRVGVAPEGEATPQRLGERVGSEGVAELLDAKQELVGLIVRVIAETGLKPLCVKIRDLCTKNINAIQPFKFRGQWQPVDPSMWPNRTKTTVRVGTGTGNHNRQVQALQGVLQIQQTIMQVPGQALVNPVKVYAALDDLTKFGELNGASKYFVDPNSPEGQQASQQVGEQMAQEKAKQDEQALQLLQAQVQLANAEMAKAEAQQAKVMAEAKLKQLQQQYDLMASGAEDELKQKELDLKRYEIETKASLELTKIEAQAKAQQDANAIANKKALSEGSNGKTGDS